MKKLLQLFTLSAIALSGLVACSGEPRWVAVYNECKQKVTDAGAQSMAKGDGEEDAQTRAMRESMTNMALGMAMSACEMIKGACEKDPDGDLCQAYIQNKE